MRVLFLTHYFPPEVNAPASRTYEHCRVWVEHGHDVSVLTCAPNHPAGKVYPGYRNRLWQTEQISGVRVQRMWTLLAANRGVVWRSANYFSYMVIAIILCALTAAHRCRDLHVTSIFLRPRRVLRQ